MGGITWSKKEDELIRKYYKYNLEQLTGLLVDRTLEAIIIRAGRLGVSRQHWMDYEDEIVRKYYPRYGTVHCMKKLKCRTVTAIQCRALKLGVKRKKGKMTPSEMNVLLLSKW